MAITPLVPVAMFGWIPVVIGLFKRLSAHRAVIAGFLLAWMFLPQYEYDLPGLPDYNKVSAAGFGVLVGVLMYSPATLARFRFHAYDLPMALWCASTFISSVSNGLGVYDGLSSTLTRITSWGIPYFIGRVFFDDARKLGELCLGFFLGTLLYVPFCLYEVVMSPRLHKIVYGYHPHLFGQAKRGGGWRPVVFMKHGLMNAMWMVSGTLAGLWLLRAGRLAKKLPVLALPALPCVLLVLVTTILCKSMGAFSLMVLGLLALLAAVKFKTRLPLLILMALPLLYMTTRGTGAWDAQNFLQVVRSISSEERAGSLEFRVENENMLIDKALEQKFFGWGGWKRSYVRDAQGQTISVPDGFWIIVFGQNGLFGLAAVTALLLLPQVLFLRLFPLAEWTAGEAAAVLPLSLMLNLYMLDNLLNDMFNPVLLLAVGGLITLARRREAGESIAAGAPEGAAPEPAREGPRLL